MSVKKHLQNALDKRAAQHRETLAKEKRDYGRIRAPEEQVGIRRNLWKSWSRVRFPSEDFRKGWDQISWR